jgi:hypothetical protein
MQKVRAEGSLDRRSACSSRRRYGEDVEIGLAAPSRPDAATVAAPPPSRPAWQGRETGPIAQFGEVSPARPARAAARATTWTGCGITYTGGVDGWIDDCMAMTRAWASSSRRSACLSASGTARTDDVLSPRAHAEYLLAAIPGAARFELESGHVLGDADLDAIYTFLTRT